MPLIDEMGSFLKMLRVYLLGRGLLTFSILGATFLGSAIGFSLMPAVIAIGGAVLSGVMRLSAESIYEDKMVDLYRDDIANQLHIAPEEVTREHLKIAAKDNDVIDQALIRQRRKNVISFGTSVLAGAATFGLLHFALAQNVVGDALVEFFSNYFGKAANVLRYLSVGLVSGTSSLLLHDGLEMAIGQGTGVAKAAAHDLIVTIARDLRHGRSITPEQVYAVLVTEDEPLAHAIKNQFGKSYTHMTAVEQRRVLATIGVADDMIQLADDITQGIVKPGHLAYVIGDTYSRTHPRAAVEEGIKPVHHFVEKLGLAPRHTTTYAEHVMAERALPQERAMG